VRLGSAALRVLAACAIGLGLLFGGMRLWSWAHHAPAFALKTVTFEGLHRAQGSDLLKLGGVAQGENLFDLHPSELEQAMLANPWVRTVNVTRHLPSGLDVAITEHTPTAIVAMGDLYLLDEDGVPFKKLEPIDTLDLPLITGIDREAYLRDPKSAGARFARALETLRAYPTVAGRGEALSEVHFDDDDVTLVTQAGQRIRLGEGELGSALGRLAEVRRALTRRGLVAEVIHLEDRVRPGWVAVKLSASVSERSGDRK
jgi:cell division protein FtsQ